MRATLISLKENHRIGSYEYMNRVRRRIAAELPQLSAYFQSGGLVDAVLCLGLPAPIDIQVSGSNMELAHQTATEIARHVHALPGVSDVLVAQDTDYPALRLDVDRQRAAQLGLSSKDVIHNVITVLAFDLAQARYNNGVSSIVELNQAQLNEISAEIAVANTRYDYLLQRTVLNYQTGMLH